MNAVIYALKCTNIFGCLHITSDHLSPFAHHIRKLKPFSTTSSRSLHCRGRSLPDTFCMKFCLNQKNQIQQLLCAHLDDYITDFSFKSHLHQFNFVLRMKCMQVLNTKYSQHTCIGSVPKERCGKTICSDGNSN